MNNFKKNISILLVFITILTNFNLPVYADKLDTFNSYKESTNTIIDIDSIYTNENDFNSEKENTSDKENNTENEPIFPVSTTKETPIVNTANTVIQTTPNPNTINNLTEPSRRMNIEPLINKLG